MLIRTDPNYITDADRATLSHMALEAKCNAQPIADINGKLFNKIDLSAAFDLVRNKANWKNPIDCELQLTGEQIALIRDAVIYFAGCEPTFRAVGTVVQFDNGGNAVLTYRVQAKGYYNAVGA